MCCKKKPAFLYVLVLSLLISLLPACAADTALQTEESDSAAVNIAEEGENSVADKAEEEKVDDIQSDIVEETAEPEKEEQTALPEEDDQSESSAETETETAEEEPQEEPEEELNMEPLTGEYFDNAAFIGDSVSGALQYYAYRWEGMGDALFLCENSFSAYAAVNNYTLWTYRGYKYPIWDVLAKAQVDKVFIMLGMNDLKSNGLDTALESYQTLIEKIKEANPDIVIFIQSCTPVYANGEQPPLTNENMDKYNEAMRVYAEENGHVFVNIAPHFKDENGGLKEEYCRDGYVHLYAHVGEYWAELLKDPANYSVSPYLFE